jgi:hypothetical protein
VSAAGPAIAEDVLVERLTAADAEREATVEQHGRRRGRLGDDGRVDAHGGTGHGRRHPHPRGRLGDRADRRPHKPAVALLIVPGVEVIGNPETLETGPLSHAGLSDELAGAELLTR